MAELPRLNSVIRQLEQGKHAFTTFTQPVPETAAALATSNFDGIVFELEHNPWDINALKDSLQYMLNRQQIASSGSVAPQVTPFVRIPPNGAEMNQWFAKQALDIGVYGIIWPHIDTVEQARNAVGACRYPRLPSAPMYDPPGLRGDAPVIAARYWGISQPEYYKKADVWPLNPEGEVLVILMIESVQAMNNLPDMLEQVPGIGVILIGEGDLSQELGFPRQYTHPVVVEHLNKIVEICKAHNVPVGHAHVGDDNVEHVIDWGFRWLMAGPTTSYSTLNEGRRLTNRA